MTEDIAADQQRSPRPDQPLRPLDRVIDGRVTRLTKTRQTSGTTAALARLRANVGRPPGQDPDIWGLTLEGITPEARQDDSSPEEWAAHVALTLFAVHQQSVDAPMHHRGIGFGRAVAMLDGRHPHVGDGISPVRRRFNAVVTSWSVEELAHHVRGLVGQMRSERIGFDYAAFADDLLEFQRPGGADVVRRRWGRQLHRLDHAAELAQPQSTTHTDLPEENR
jgi:CRISPR system Cascade subunit CasB